MLLTNTNDKNAFDFSRHVYQRLLKKFYNNGIEPKISHKIIFQYLSVLFRLNRSESFAVLKMLEQKGMVELRRIDGNGNYVVTVKTVISK